MPGKHAIQRNGLSFPERLCRNSLLHLLFVIDTFALGGAQRQMVNLAVGLRNKGHQIDFFRYVPGDTLLPQVQAAQIPVHTYFKRFRYDPRVFFELNRIMHKGKYELILSFLPHSNFYALVSALPLRNKSCVVVSERSASQYPGTKWRKSVFRHYYRLANHITTNSHHQRIYLSQKYSWSKGKISTIYNGLDLEFFHPPVEEPPDEPFKLIAIGSIHSSKNARCVIEALATLRDQYGICPQVSWAGRHFNDHSKELNLEIEKHNLIDQWHWLGEQTDIVSLLHQHHALVHPSYIEGLPNVVCEALACGRPVLISDTLDHPRLVQHGKSGFLFDWKAPETLAKCIREFWSLSTQERHQMGLNGRQYAEQYLSLNQMLDSYENLFVSLLNSRKG